MSTPTDNPFYQPAENSGWCLASRVESVWRHVMHDLLGYRDYCESTPQFEHIDYAYTGDATDECVAKGEALWKHLMSRFGGTDNMGQVVLTGWGVEAPHAGGPGRMSTITRRREMWSR